LPVHSSQHSWSCNSRSLFLSRNNELFEPTAINPVARLAAIILAAHGYLGAAALLLLHVRARRTNAMHAGLIRHFIVRRSAATGACLGRSEITRGPSRAIEPGSRVHSYVGFTSPGSETGAAQPVRRQCWALRHGPRWFPGARAEARFPCPPGSFRSMASHADRRKEPRVPPSAPAAKLVGSRHAGNSTHSSP
jgi:hypothetical protein